MSQVRKRCSGLVIALTFLLLISGVLAALPNAKVEGQPGTLTLTTPNPVSNGEFGYSVALSNDTVVVGAPYETVSGMSGAGEVYLFNSATGALVQTLTDPNPQIQGHFGISVSISGNTVVAGASDVSVSGNSDDGQAYVFDAATGSLIATLNSPYPAYEGDFGRSVAVSGSSVIIGAFGESAAGDYYAGRAYLFGAVSGNLAQSLASPSPQTTGLFGRSVAISGDAVVVGAPGQNASGVHQAGQVYIFDATTGGLTQTFSSPNPVANGFDAYIGNFGFSVAASGNTVAVGAPYDNEGGYTQGGAVYVFDATTGALTQTITSPNPSTEEYFGTSIAISGNTVAVGANDLSASGNAEAGLVYIFNASTGALVQTLSSPNAQFEGSFGISVAVSGNTVAVGAAGEAEGTIDGAGNAYVTSISSTPTTSATTASIATSVSATSPVVTTSIVSSTTISSSSESSSLTVISSTSTSSGIPEFPFQIGLLTLATLVVLTAYALTRRSAKINAQMVARVTPSRPTLGFD